MHASDSQRSDRCARRPMEGFAVAAAIALLLCVSVASARVLLHVLLPSRQELVRLQTERIERMLRDDDVSLEEVEVTS